jgi:myo-inositol-1(or 4)-monophosphatase
MTELACQARDFAKTLALEAANKLRQSVGQKHDVEFKSPGDWCSVLDRQIEDHLRQRIAERFPDHGFLGEESAHTEIKEGLLWVVDPIDGSMNFLRGYPQYAISIALLSDGEPLAACIVDPSRQEVFSAAAGHGACLNDTPLHVAQTVALSKAVAATVFPKPQSTWMPGYLTEFGQVVSSMAGVRRSGSMALELAYLAAGRVDTFWAHGMGSWDAAAGVLLIREAGGQVFTLDGLRWCDSQSIAAAAPGVAKAWLALLRPEAH